MATTLIMRAKAFVRQVQTFLRWAVQDLPQAPGFAIYARRMDRMNGKGFVKTRAAEAAGAVPPHYENFYPRAIPKTIWIYWAQGEEDAPHVVQRCLESWRARNPGWELRVLDEESANALIDLSDVPEGLPRRFRANMLRLRLLKNFGGVWTDATTFCHRPFEDWLPMQAASGFFSFSDPGADRWLGNWFIASEQDGDLITVWEAAYTAYLTRQTRTPKTYFMLTYSFQWAVLRNPELKAAWARVARLPSTPTFFLMSAIRGHMPMEEVKKAVALGLPISKLSWKVDVSPEDIDIILADMAGPGSDLRA